MNITDTRQSGLWERSSLQLPIYAETLCVKMNATSKPCAKNVTFDSMAHNTAKTLLTHER